MKVSSQQHNPSIKYSKLLSVQRQSIVIGRSLYRAKMVARTTAPATRSLGDATELAPLDLADGEAAAGSVAAAPAGVAAASFGVVGAAEAEAADAAAFRGAEMSMGSMRGVEETELRSMELSALRTSEFMPRTARVQ